MIIQNIGIIIESLQNNSIRRKKKQKNIKNLSIGLPSRFALKLCTDSMVLFACLVDYDFGFFFFRFFFEFKNSRNYSPHAFLVPRGSISDKVFHCISVSDDNK